MGKIFVSTWAKLRSTIVCLTEESGLEGLDGVEIRLHLTVAVVGEEFVPHAFYQLDLAQQIGLWLAYVHISLEYLVQTSVNLSLTFLNFREDADLVPRRPVSENEGANGDPVLGLHVVELGVRPPLGDPRRPLLDVAESQVHEGEVVANGRVLRGQFYVHLVCTWVNHSST